jgi:hypothetical protein
VTTIFAPLAARYRLVFPVPRAIHQRSTRLIDFSPATEVVSMTALELSAIVDQRMTDPAVLGRLACNLHSNDVLEQRHNDNRHFTVSWQDSGDFWRCIIASDDQASPLLARVDIHENATVRIETYEPCRVTISPEEGFLCLTRYKRPSA